MADPLLCHICFEAYTDIPKHKKIPRILKCGHTFCTECLQKIANKSNKNKIICPIDREVGSDTKDINQITINRNIFDQLCAKNLCHSKLAIEPDILFSENTPANFDKNFKVITLGTCNTGKSALSDRMVKNNFTDDYVATVNIEILIKFIKYKDKIYRLQLMDTCGQEGFQSITSLYIKGTHGVIFVYDITDRASFEQVENWIELYKTYNGERNKILGILIGNKVDLEHQRKVTFDEGKNVAEKYGIMFFETSAKTGKNTQNAFSYLVKVLSEHFYVHGNKLDEVESFNLKDTKNFSCLGKVLCGIKDFFTNLFK